MLIALLRTLLRWLYRFEAHNESVLTTPGPVLLLPNHVSWWDWLLLGVCLEPDWRFVTSSTTANLSWLHRRIMINRRTFPVDINSPYAVKHMAEYLQKGGRLVLFPEGRLSCTGSLMKLFDGTGFLIFKTHAKVITAYIRGAHRLPFSPNPNRKRWFPRLSVHFSALQAPPSMDHRVSVSEARVILTDWLRHRMVGQQFETEMRFAPATVPEAVLHSAQTCPNKVIVEDLSQQTLTYRRLLVGAELLARQWRTRLDGAPQRIGVLLPNVNAMPVVLLSLWSANQVPAILNYTVGPSVLLACARLAGLRQVITSRKFVDRAGLDLRPLQEAGVELLFLEDLRAGISQGQKLAVLLGSYLHSPITFPASQADAAAVILFTSGSEGEPKGVELSHANLLANIRQMLAVIDLTDTDRFFNALPLFHSFGLTVGLFLPLVQGVFVFLYPSPLHYRVVPSAFYNLDCTVFFGTNTFLMGYGRKAHPYDFRKLRYLFAGAEKIQEHTSTLWMRKFGVRVLEGYGATECSPCISVNVPMHPRHGSAGQLLPAIDYRLEPVEGISLSTFHPPASPAHHPAPAGHNSGPESHSSPPPSPSLAEKGNEPPHPSPLSSSGGERRGEEAPPSVRSSSLSSPGGEGRGEEASLAKRRNVTPSRDQSSPPPGLDDPHGHDADDSAHHTHQPALVQVGRLLVRGPNVMRGYLNLEANARFQALAGWYDTGDIAGVDKDGFVYILGRLKRFAKVSGEMVSLTAVEDALSPAFPQYGLKFAIAVIAQPDAMKGEKLIAVTNEPRLTLEEVRQAIRARGLSNLSVPRELKVMHELPHLGTGKINHRELQRMIA